MKLQVIFAFLFAFILSSISLKSYGMGAPSAGAQDCSTALAVCTDASFTGNSSGAGTNISELSASNQGCLSTEHQSSWYRFTVSASGVIELDITTTVDYDFAIWSGTACPPTSAPVRCSFAAGGGVTGLQVKGGGAETTEGAGGDRYVDELVVTAGQTYTMLIDNFATDGTDFTLDWTLSSGAAMTCTPLPIVISDFGLKNKDFENEIWWQSIAEYNYDHTVVQKSRDGIHFEDLEIHKSRGSDGGEYYCSDKKPYLNTYYRLKQVSKNGEEIFSETKNVKINSAFQKGSIRPNPVSSKAFIDLFLERSDQVTMVITDVSGNISLSEKNTLSAGNNTVDVDIGELKKGMYFLKIISDTGEVLTYSKFTKE